MNMLVAMASPIRPLASSVAATNAALPLPQASMMSRCRSLPGSCQFGFFTNSAVGVTLAFTTARVREGAIFAIASVLAVTTRSQPMIRSAPPVSSRAACRSSGRAATRTCDITAPYFCARPDMSSTETPLRLIQRRKPRFGDGRKFVAGGGSGFALPETAAFHGDEARAEALQAGVVLIARRLVDDALAAELGLERLDRKAVRLDAAVAAALAHPLVDDGADRRVRIGVALAAAALFRGAGLVVDQRRDAGHLAQLSLHPVELVAVADRYPRRPIGARRVFLRLVGDDDDRLHAFGGELARDDRRVERAVVALPAGHRHRVVVEDLVGHVDLRRHRGADREQPRMEVRAVAEIGEDVLLVSEGRLADPRRAFGSHVREGGRAAIHPYRHEMAADARGSAAAFRNARRGVVRAARAEIGLAYSGH